MLDEHRSGDVLISRSSFPVPIHRYPTSHQVPPIPMASPVPEAPVRSPAMAKETSSWWAFDEPRRFVSSREPESQAAADALVVSLDGSGGYRCDTTLGNEFLTQALDVDMTPNGRVYVSGTFAGILDFGGGPVAAEIIDGFDGQVAPIGYVLALDGGCSAN